MRHRRSARNDRRRGAAWRRGAAAVEGAIATGVLFLVLFATFDLGLATLRYNMLSATARRIARNATVRGALAPPDFAAWGPSTYAGTAADSSEIAQNARALLPTMKPAEVAVQVTWPDGGNDENDHVHVEVTYEHTPFVPFLLLGGPLYLEAESTMQIVH